MGSRRPEDEVEMSQLGKKIGKDVRRALLEKDRIVETKEYINKLNNDLVILERARTIISPLNEDARLVWSDGHSIDETINELHTRIRKTNKSR